MDTRALTPAKPLQLTIPLQQPPPKPPKDHWQDWLRLREDRGLSTLSPEEKCLQVRDAAEYYNNLAIQKQPEIQDWERENLPLWKFYGELLSKNSKRSATIMRGRLEEAMGYRESEMPALAKLNLLELLKDILDLINKTCYEILLTQDFPNIFMQGFAPWMALLSDLIACSENGWELAKIELHKNDQRLPPVTEQIDELIGTIQPQLAPSDDPKEIQNILHLIRNCNHLLDTAIEAFKRNPEALQYFESKKAALINAIGVGGCP